MDDTLQDILDKNGLHKGMIAKKFHEKRSQVFTPSRAFLNLQMPRRKRSAPSKHQNHANPYLQGEPLRTVSKKDGKATW